MGKRMSSLRNGARLNCPVCNRWLLVLFCALDTMDDFMAIVCPRCGTTYTLEIALGEVVDVGQVDNGSVKSAQIDALKRQSRLN